MTKSARWEPGTVVTYQEVWDGKLWSARPVRVAVDRPDLLALWCPEGTRVKGPFAPWRPGRAAGAEYFVAMLTHQDWGFGDFSWPTSNLMLLRPHDWHAVWVSWNADGDNWGWYINFQRPPKRTAHSLQSMDLMLDLIVDQDGNWRWKDQDEFEALVTPGIIGAEEAARVRQEAEAIVARLGVEDPPFCDPWHDWRPDPSWELPALPPDWYVL